MFATAFHRFMSVWLIACSCVVSAAETDSASIQFERTIRPILAKHCFACHGEEVQESDLRLDSLSSLLVGGTRGPAIEAGNTDSLLLKAIRHTGDLKMPKDQAALSASEIEHLTQWVVAGAHWPSYTGRDASVEANFMEARAKHWAYQPLANPPLPIVSQQDWPHSPIDFYILRGLEDAQLHPSPQADKRTLIRRVSYDLTGLPPTPEAVEAFVNDARPDAFAQLVESLLASPQYGERWARHWLDVVRYTDSFDSRGNEKTDPIEIWRYRDWVVNALNNNMPYDRFVSDQIAGDVTPLTDGAFNRDGVIATGMLAIGNWPQGDADKQKMVADIVDDQVDVVTRAFLSTTMACARCHDHKFDPFSTEDYYGLSGIFFSSSILPGPGMKTEGSPILHIPLASEATLNQRALDQTRLDEVRKEQAALLDQARRDFSTKHIPLTEQYLVAAYTQQANADLNPEVLRHWTRILNGEIIPALHIVDRNTHNFPGLDSRHDAESTPSAVVKSTDTEIRYSTIIQPAHSLVIHPGPAEGVGIGWRAPEAAILTVTGYLSDADPNCGEGIEWALIHRTNGREESLAVGQFDNTGKSVVTLDGPVGVEAGDHITLLIQPGASHSCDTTEVYLTIQSESGSVWSTEKDILPHFTESNLWADAYGNSDVWWMFRENNKSHLDATLFAPWWSALGALPAGETNPSAMQGAAQAIQATIDAALHDPSSPMHATVNQLHDVHSPFWLTQPPIGESSPLTALEAELHTLEAKLNSSIDYAIGIQEGGVPDTEYVGFHDARVHRRGEYSNLGALVPRQMPALIKGTSPRLITQGSGRLDLAHWLTEECSPLLARVMVNRVWQHHFGVGLVNTPSDFGTQGQQPTHPELLETLANEFIESGWSLKALHRTMLNSATYQQQSLASEAPSLVDPENRLLGHMNRRRLDAESLRDTLMATTERLDLTMGGPAFTDVSTPRRTLYLRTVRSNLNTYATLFDGADPTTSISMRNESTVAPQALYLLNHPLILSAAESLSHSLDDDPVQAMYRRLYTRPLTQAELGLAESTLKSLGYPEAEQALTAYAQILLCSNEFFFID